MANLLSYTVEDAGALTFTCYAPPPKSDLAGPSPGAIVESGKRKRTAVRRACERCRRSKTACSEFRPCGPCKKRGCECVDVEDYATQKARKDMQEYMVRAVRERATSHEIARALAKLARLYDGVAKTRWGMGEGPLLAHNNVFVSVCQRGPDPVRAGLRCCDLISPAYPDRVQAYYRLFATGKCRSIRMVQVWMVHGVAVPFSCTITLEFDAYGKPLCGVILATPATWENAMDLAFLVLEKEMIEDSTADSPCAGPAAGASARLTGGKGSCAQSAVQDVTELVAREAARGAGGPQRSASPPRHGHAGPAERSQRRQRAVEASAPGRAAAWTESSGDRRATAESAWTGQQRHAAGTTAASACSTTSHPDMCNGSTAVRGVEQRDSGCGSVGQSRALHSRSAPVLLTAEQLMGAAPVPRSMGILDGLYGMGMSMQGAAHDRLSSLLHAGVSLEDDEMEAMLLNELCEDTPPAKRRKKKNSGHVCSSSLWGVEEWTPSNPEFHAFLAHGDVGADGKAPFYRERTTSHSSSSEGAWADSPDSATPMSSISYDTASPTSCASSPAGVDVSPFSPYESPTDVCTLSPILQDLYAPGIAPSLFATPADYDCLPDLPSQHTAAPPVCDCEVYQPSGHCDIGSGHS